MSAIRREHDAGRVTRTRRRRLTVAAAAGTVTAIVASAIVGGLAASAAAGSPPGYQVLDGWQLGTSSVEVHFPGTFEGLGAMASLTPLDGNGFPGPRQWRTAAMIGARRCERSIRTASTASAPSAATETAARSRIA